MEEQGLPILLILALFPVAICGMWFLVLRILSSVGGWAELAECYSDTATKPSYSHVFQSGRMGFVNYNGVLKIGASVNGLHLAVWAIFKPFYQPIVIPWEDVRDVEYFKLLFSRRVRFRASEAPSVRIQLPENSVKQAYEHFISNARAQAVGED